MQKIRKVLVVRFSSIGDIVLTTPVVRCIRQQIPGCEVHYLTKEIYADMLRQNHMISKVHTIRKNVGEVAAELRQENFDFIVDLHRNLRSAQTLMLLGKPFGQFKKLNVRKWLYVNLKLRVLPPVHIVERYFGAVKKLKVKYDGAGLDFFIPEAVQNSISSQLPDEFSTGYVVIVIGSKQKTKQMPVELVTELSVRLNYPVVFLGGKEDQEKAEGICSVIGAKAFNACGKFNITGSAALIQASRCVITPDTGMMHIAAALRKPVVSVWGNTVPEFGMWPFYPSGKEMFRVIEVKGLPCRPCSKLGYETCPKKHFMCMHDIDPQQIIDAVNQFTGS